MPSAGHSGKEDTGGLVLMGWRSACPRFVRRLHVTARMGAIRTQEPLNRFGRIRRLPEISVCDGAGYFGGFASLAQGF